MRNSCEYISLGGGEGGDVAPLCADADLEVGLVRGQVQVVALDHQRVPCNAGVGEVIIE